MCYCSRIFNQSNEKLPTLPPFRSRKLRELESRKHQQPDTTRQPKIVLIPKNSCSRRYFDLFASLNLPNFYRAILYSAKTGMQTGTGSFFRNFYCDSANWKVSNWKFPVGRGDYFHDPLVQLALPTGLPTGIFGRVFMVFLDFL